MSPDETGDRPRTGPAPATVGETTTKVAPRSDGTLPILELVSEHVAQTIRTRVRVWPTGCHVWTGARNDDGYAYMSLAGLVVRVSRVTWTLAHGRDVPVGMVVDHVAARGCVTRACVNPEHLEAVTPRSNVVRGRDAARERHGQTRIPDAGERS